MIKKFLITLMIAAALILVNGQNNQADAADVWIASDSNGSTLYAISETFEYEDGDDICAIDFKFIPAGGQPEIGHCIMDVAGNYFVQYRGESSSSEYNIRNSVLFRKLYDYLMYRCNNG